MSERVMPTRGPVKATIFENARAAHDQVGAFGWSVSSVGDCFNGGRVADVGRAFPDGSTTGLPGCVEVSEADGLLIAAAFNAATAAADLGFDPIGAVGALPALLESLMSIRDECGYPTAAHAEIALAAARTRRGE